MNNADVFAARLARIQAGGPNTKGTIFVGQDEQHHFGQKSGAKPGKGREVAGNALYPLSLLGAFGLGLLAVALGFYARFQLMAGQAQLEDADLEMAVSGGIGLVLSFVLAQMFRLTSKEHKAMQAAGVFVMVCGFHNLAHWAPGPMATLLSPDWVAQVRAEAPVNSARFRGVYFPLFDAGSAAMQATETGSDAPAAPSPCITADAGVKRIQLDNDKKAPAKPTASGCEGG